MEMPSTSTLRSSKNKPKKLKGIGYLNDLSKALKFKTNPKKLSLHWSDSNVLVKVLFPLTPQPKIKAKSGMRTNYRPVNSVRRNIDSFNKSRGNVAKHKSMKNLTFPINTTNRIKLTTNAIANRNVHEQIAIEVPAVSPQYERITKSTVALGEGLKSVDKYYYSLHDKQCLVMSIIALAYSKISPTNAWNRKMLQKIFTHSCHLYHDVVTNEKALPCLENLPSTIRLGTCTLKVKLQGDFLGGIIRRNPRKPHIKSFLKGLQEFFETKFSRALVKYNNNTCAIWRQRGAYYLFELYPRDFKGERKGVCTVSLRKHDSCKSLVKSFYENTSCKGHDCIYVLHAFTVIQIFEQNCRYANDVHNINRSSSVEWSKFIGFNGNNDKIEQETLSVSRSIGGKSTKLIFNKLRSNSDHGRNVTLANRGGNELQNSLNSDDLLPVLEFLKSHISELYDRSLNSRKNDNIKKLTTSSRNSEVESLSTIDLNSPASSLPIILDEIGDYVDGASASTSQETLVGVPLAKSTPKRSATDLKENELAHTAIEFDDSNSHSTTKEMLEIHEVTGEDSIAEHKKEAATSSTELEKSRDIGKTASEQAMNLHEEVAYYWLRKSFDEDDAMLSEM